MTTKFKGNAVQLDGTLIAKGNTAPQISLVKNDLSSFTLDDCKGKRVIMNIFPSIDTGVCATSVRKFNQFAASLPDTIVLCISRDLPLHKADFALPRV